MKMNWHNIRELDGAFDIAFENNLTCRGLDLDAFFAELDPLLEKHFPDKDARSEQETDIYQSAHDAYLCLSEC